MVNLLLALRKTYNVRTETTKGKIFFKSVLEGLNKQFHGCVIRKAGASSKEDPIPAMHNDIFCNTTS